MRDGASRRRRNPPWIPPFLGRVPASVPDGHLSLLGAVALAIFFENYDQAMLTQAIKQIAADFGVVEAEIGNLLALSRLGAVPAFLLVPFADQIGRRRLFLLSVIGMSVATAASAVALDVRVFVVTQMVARLFMVTGAATAFVIVAEEFRAEHRGWGIGILSALGALGVGLSAALFAAIEVLPYGWRAMYVVGALPLLALPRLRRLVTETARWDRHREERASGPATSGSLAGWWRPLASLLRAYPLRTALVGLIGAASSAASASAYNFSAYFVQVVHGWEPRHYSLMLVVAGGAGIVGHPFAGRFADARGRRRVGFAFYSALPLLAFAFYTVPGWLLPLVWVPMVFALTGGMTVARALSTELFPTSYRGTASGWLQLLDTLGSALGLFLVSALTAPDASAIPAVRTVVFVSLVASVAVLCLPETGRLELEDISEESPPPPVPGAPRPAARADDGPGLPRDR